MFAAVIALQACDNPCGCEDGPDLPIGGTYRVDDPYPPADKENLEAQIVGEELTITYIDASGNTVSVVYALQKW